MAPPLRIEFPGVLYHVTSRGQSDCRICQVFLESHHRWSVLHSISSREGEGVRKQWTRCCGMR